MSILFQLNQVFVAKRTLNESNPYADLANSTLSLNLDQQTKPEHEPLMFSLKIILAFALLSVGIFLICQKSVYTVPAGIILVSSMFAHFIELQHQCIHNSAYKSVTLNKLFGILFGLPSLVSFHSYKKNHLKHHKLISTGSLGGEFFNYQRTVNPSIYQLIRDSFTLSRISNTLTKEIPSALVKAFTKTGERDKTSLNYVIILFWLLSLIATLIYFDIFVLGILSYICCLILSEVIHFYIELPEHYGCFHRHTKELGLTRTIRSNAFMFWFTNGNNLHTEHHLFPSAAISHLPKIHSEIFSDLIHYNTGYKEFFYHVVTPRKYNLRERGELQQ